MLVSASNGGRYSQLWQFTGVSLKYLALDYPMSRQVYRQVSRSNTRSKLLMLAESNRIQAGSWAFNQT